MLCKRLLSFLILLLLFADCRVYSFRLPLQDQRMSSISHSGSKNNPNEHVSAARNPSPPSPSSSDPQPLDSAIVAVVAGGQEQASSFNVSSHNSRNDSSKKRPRQQNLQRDSSSSKLFKTASSSCGGNNQNQKMNDPDQAAAPQLSTTAVFAASPMLITPEKIKGLRLEAFFHPKFDNEKRDKQPGNPVGNGNTDVRSAMLQRLSDKQGYLEVSLKHSGSLILWSGGQRYYSKNSCRNQFTQVAEILLRQHFVRAFWNNSKRESSITGDSSNGPADEWTECHYQQCSDYLEQHRLTCAFEVVTAVLGDHGQIPKRDFLILTAVADRQHERFLTTAEVLEFCQRFRLPHNDVWTFETPESAGKLFDLYDSSKETGKADDTVEALTETADSYVPSMYPHDVFQGDILEGFIIRYVANPTTTNDVTNNDAVETEPIMHRLGKTAMEILKDVPPNLPPSFLLVQQQTNRNLIEKALPPKVLTTDVRDIQQLVATAATNELAMYLAPVLDQDSIDDGSHTSNATDKSRHDLVKFQQEDGRMHLPSLVKHLVGDEEAIADVETRRIAQLLQTLDSIKGVVKYSLFMMPGDDGDVIGNGSTDRLFCMVHVMHDTTFFKYQRLQTPETMSLFRGFCIELLSQPPSTANYSDLVSNGSRFPVGNGSSEQPLMLKMKLLPYMVRTFICRNLLRVIEKDGSHMFCSRAEELMARWGMSEECIQKWSPFFAAWAAYVKSTKVVIESQPDSELSELGPLTNFSYLRHLEHFTKLYESGKIHAPTSKDMKAEDSLEAFICVVAERNEISKAIATLLAQRLSNIADSLKGKETAGDSTSNIAVISLQDAIKSKTTRSCVVYTCIGEKVKASKAFFNSRKVLKHSFIILYGSESVCLLEDGGDESWFAGSSHGECKRISSIWEKLWKNQACAHRILLPRNAVQFEPKQTDSIEAKVAATTTDFDDMTESIRSTASDLTAADIQKQKDPAKRSILVLFPGIPGCGKSSLAGSLEATLQESISSKYGKDGMERRVFVKEGDKTGKQFWDLAETLLSNENDPTPAFFVADKNTPPNSWSRVGQVCSDTRSIPLLVLPDEDAMETTAIEGAIMSDGTTKKFHSHFYPFSLKYLAISLERVLSRPAGEHSGKLDQGLPNAAVIVVQFFSFYREMSAETFCDRFGEKLEQVGANGFNLLEPIRLPFLSKDGHTKPMPEDLEALLIEALQLRLGYDSDRKAKDKDERMMELETRLRVCIERHKMFIRNMSAGLEDTRSMLMEELLHRVDKLNKMGELDLFGQKTDPESFEKIKLVSLDVDRSNVHKILTSLQTSGEANGFFDITIAGAPTSSSMNGSEKYPAPTFILQTHVTMAFAGRKLSAKSLAAKFSHLQGCQVKLKATHFIWSVTHAAFAVEIDRLAMDDSKETPGCENVFPHITIWCAPGSQAYQSNRLPQLLETGKATEVAIQPPAEMIGHMCFWNNNNQPFQID